MNRLTPVAAPDDFEQRLLVRTALSALPVASAPDDFEALLLRRLAEQTTPPPPAGSSRPWPWVIGIVAVIGLSVGGFVVSRPDNVTVRHVPVLASGGVDLHHLAPVPVAEDRRFRVVAQRPVSIRQRRGDGIVAGYPPKPAKRR